MTDVDAPLRDLRNELPSIELLPDNAFLRRLPHTLDVRQRHELEAVVLAADCISISLSRLVYLCHTVAMKPEAISTITRAEMFTAVWSIIDNLDVPYNLLFRAIKSEGPKTDALRKNLAINREIRNWRHHMKSKLDNNINKKGLSWPLFGAIYFGSTIDCECDITQTLERAKVHIIHAGSLRSDKVNTKIIDGDRIQRFSGKKLSGPYFHINSNEIDLILIQCQLNDYLKFWSDRMEEWFSAMIENYDLDESSQKDEMLNSPPVLHFVFNLEIDTPPSR
jgi:hypothetical protein